MIVGIHSTPSFMNNGSLSDAVNNVLKAIYHVGLPTFFVISGYVILSKKIENIFSWYLSRLISIAVPFLIISYIHFSYVNDNALTLQNIIIFLKLTLTSNTAISIHFWFVYAIIGIYIISPAISYLFSGISGRESLVALIIFTLVDAVNTNFSIIQRFTNAQNIFLPPSISVWIFYFMIGGFLFKCRDYIRFWMSLSMLILGLLTTVTMTYVSAKFSLPLGQYDTNASMVIYTIGFFMFTLALGEKLKHKISIRLVNFISNQSYIIYLIHVIVLTMFYRNLPWLTYNTQSNNLHFIITIICFITSMLLSYIIGFPINKIISFLRARIDKR